MSKLNLSANLFLEVAEMKRLVKFLEDDGYKLLFKNLIKGYGIAENKENTLYKVSVKPNSRNTIVVNAGIAFNENLDAIILKEDKEMVLPNTFTKQWIVISYESTSCEDGMVRISSQGVLSGDGTHFLSVLRGQPNFPTKVRFNSSVHNTEEYEVVEVNSDTSAILAGNFTEENGLKYEVIGTFTPGFQPNDEDKAIYSYDSCRIDVIENADKPTLENGQYIIASITRRNGNLEVNDERINNLLNNEYQATNSVGITTNPFVALRKTTIKGERMLDVQFEWGYKVQRYELLTTSAANIFNIVTGDSRYISNVKFPNGIFNGWLLVNRKNMVSVVIDHNENTALTITEFNPDIVTNENDDFVIVPDFSRIEIEAKVSGSNYNDDDTDYFFIYEMKNLRSRFTIPVEYLDTNVKLRYRMLNEKDTTEFQNFAITQFTNVLGQSETLGASSFDFIVEEPEEVKRNYS